MMVDDDNKLRFCRSEVGICTLKFTCLLLLQHGLACTFLFERKVRNGKKHIVSGSKHIVARLHFLKNASHLHGRDALRRRTTLFFNSPDKKSA